MNKNSERTIIHIQDTSGRRPLCGVQRPDECPTYDVSQEKLTHCDTCNKHDREYQGNSPTGYYPRSNT
jgi:hypothetical protein